MSLRMERRSMHRRKPHPGLLRSLLGNGNDGVLAPVLKPAVNGQQQPSDPQPRPASPPPAPAPPPPSSPSPAVHQNNGGTSNTNRPSPPSPTTATHGQTQPIASTPPNVPESPSSPSAGSSDGDGSSNVSSGIGAIPDSVGNVADDPNGPDDHGAGTKPNTDKAIPNDNMVTTTHGALAPNGSGTSTQVTATPAPTSLGPLLLPGQVGSGNANSGNESSPPASVPTSNATEKSTSKGSNGVMIGGVVIAAAAIIGVMLLFYLRRRHIQRRQERQVAWEADAAPEPDMTQRNSVRSSWGTPIERRTSQNPPWAPPPTISEVHENPFERSNFVVSDVAPSMPEPALSPLRSGSPENPFSDVPASPGPLKPMSSLPIRFSIISSGSGSNNHDPFDDMNGLLAGVVAYGDKDSTVTAGDAGKPMRRISVARRNLSPVSYTSSANFPMPPVTPVTPASPTSQATFVERSTPVGSLAFPDSPVSPTFGPDGTLTNCRRASVKAGFQPSSERKDEMHLQSGDRVNVISVYDDGWAFVERERNNERGLVPLGCLQLDQALAM